MKFDTHAVLSTCTGRLMKDIGGVYKVTSFLVGRDVFTHELPMFGRLAEKEVFSRLSDLPTSEDFKHVNGDNVTDVLEEWENKLGKTYEIPDKFAGAISTDKNPVETLGDAITTAHQH